MDLAAIYTMSRLNTGTTSTNISDAVLLTLTNVTYRELINIITSRVNEDFFYDELTFDTVANQKEYTFPVRDADTAWLKKLISVWIKYNSSDDYFRIGTPTKLSNLPYDATYYAENQPSTDPFYTVADKSVFIYPTPTTSTTSGWILYGITDPIELQAAATEVMIKIPVDYHQLIVLGNEYKIYKTRQLQDDATRAYNYFVTECNRMVTEISDRIIKPLESAMPSLNQYE